MVVLKKEGRLLLWETACLSYNQGLLCPDYLIFL